MSKQGPKVLIAGVAGFNRGDDAIAHALVQQLRAHFELGEILVTVLRPGVFSQPSVREVVIDRKDPRSHLALWRAVADSSFVVIGGGSIIQDEIGASWLRGIMALFVEVVLLARALGRPVVTAPIGIDTLHSAIGERMARTILSHCALVAVRDAASAANGRALLGPNARITLGADPAFCLARPSAPRTEREPCLVLAPAFEAGSSPALSPFCARIVEGFLRSQPGARCRILAMDERAHEDGGKIASILEQIDPLLRSAVELTIARSVEQVLGILRGAQVLVAMRLHAMILAAGTTPTLCLSRGVKTDALARELAVPVISLRHTQSQPSPDFAQIEARVSAFLAEMQSERARDRQLQACALALEQQAARMRAYLGALQQVLSRRVGLAGGSLGSQAQP